METVSVDGKIPGLVFEGRSVSLATPDDADFERIAEWIADPRRAALSGDVNEKASAEQLREVHRSGTVCFLTVVTASGELLGAVNYRPGGVPGNYAIGGTIGPPELWSRGFGADAFGLLIYLLFGQLDAWRVQVSAGMHNRQMIQMLAMSGMFVLEGVQRGVLLIDGRRYDSTIWSMLREEFEVIYQDRASGVENPSPSPVIAPEEAEVAARLLRRYLATNPVTSLSAYQNGAGHPEG